MKTIDEHVLMKKLGKLRSVGNLKREGSKSAAANQFILEYENGSAFKQYESLIAVRTKDGKLFLTKKHDFSATTKKYTSQWTGYSTKERTKGIEDETFTLIVQKMKRKYHYEWASYTDNMNWGRQLIARDRSRGYVEWMAKISGKGAYIVQRERVYD